MKLTPNFTLAEMTHSDTARSLGLDNSPPAEVLNNLRRVAETLEQVRALVGRPITVLSGYRSPEVNKAVGSTTNRSAHLRGLAADITCPGMTPLELAQAIRDSGITFDQLIREPDWTHIGLSERRPRGELLTGRRVKVNGKVQMVYSAGLE